MVIAAAEIYRQGALARCRILDPGAGEYLLDREEIYGLLPTAAHPRARLVVVDDAALPTVAAALTPAVEGVVAVAETAGTCVQYLRSRPGWRGSPATAMALTDARSMPKVSWPDGLRLVPVRRTPDYVPGEVTLSDAVALLDADGPVQPQARQGLERHLAGLPETRVLAAVDLAGAVCATSAFGLYGGFAHVIFVNTHPAWRRLGVATAMTAAAVAGAVERGATAASLDASAAGRGPYERLGFVAAMTTMRFADHRR